MKVTDRFIFEQIDKTNEKVNVYSLNNLYNQSQLFEHKLGREQILEDLKPKTKTNAVF